MIILKKNFSPIEWFVFIVIMGTVIRLIMPFRGHNFDIDSYRIVADIMASGGNVYAETTRYNYGPIWFHILSFLDNLPCPSVDPLLCLRWKVTVFLTLIDIAIAAFLYRWYGNKVASLFFLNPISIIITGYHAQFDNLAILFGLIGVKAIENDGASNSYRTIAGLSLLGLSLSVKHILFLFPLWLAMKNERWRNKLLFIAIPYGLFTIGFLPYLPDGTDGIIGNVFRYRSFANAPFWIDVAPRVIASIFPTFLLFIGTLIILGLLWRKKKPLESLFLYLVSLVVFSSAIANQYLVICIAAISVQWNIMYALYSIAGTAYLLTSGSGLHILLLRPWLGNDGSSVIGYSGLIFLLALGLLQTTLSKENKEKLFFIFRRVIGSIKNEIMRQIKSPW